MSFNAALLVGSAPLALAQVVNLMGSFSTFTHSWKRCVGTGHMLLGTRVDWREHLSQARDDLGFDGIRGHGIFDDDMSTMPRPGQYEFFNVDAVYDFLIDSGVRPIVELSFMPMALANCKPEDCRYAFRNHAAYKGLTMPPADFNGWHDLVKTFATHLVERYGLDEVAKWRFEVWNEMWGIDFPQPYMQLYNASAVALKSVSSRLRVGGPATMQVLNVAEFVRAAQAANLPFDFVSTHLYPTDPECRFGEMSCFTRMIADARDFVRKNSGAEFMITEFNAGLSLTEPLDLDGPYAAAFVFRQIGALEDLDAFSWWTFTDIFEEQWQVSSPFHNGFGLQTIHGVAKPSYRAFQLLKDAGAWRAPVAGVSPAAINASLSVLATADRADLAQATSVQLFVADWSPLRGTRFSCRASAGKCEVDPQGSYTDIALCSAQCGGGQFTAQPSNKVQITIQHGGKGIFSAASKLHATIVRLDDNHANAKAAWIKMGRPSYLKSGQIALLKQASLMQEEQFEVQQTSSTTALVTIDLPPFSAARVSITAAELTPAAVFA